MIIVTIAEAYFMLTSVLFLTYVISLILHSNPAGSGNVLIGLLLQVRQLKCREINSLD